MAGQSIRLASDEVLEERARFTITGRGTVLIVRPIYARGSLVGRTVDIDGAQYTVLGVEDCLVPGHRDGHCDQATGLLVRPVPAEPIEEAS